jgi:hydrophobe/amphiphile efflux-3 (HAE3) family protein
LNRALSMLTGMKPGVALIAHVSIIVLMLFGISRLELRNNDDADLPRTDPIVKTNERFEEIFGSKDRVLISLESEDAFSPESLVATRQIADAFVGLKWVVGNEIKSLATIKNIEPGDQGLSVAHLYGSDRVDREVAASARTKARANPLIWGRVVSEDGRASLILVNVVRGSDQAQVYEDTYRILAPYRDKFNVRVIGDLILSESIDRGIQDDAVVLFPIAIVLQLLILYLVFRDYRYVFACVGTTVVSIVWTMGIMGWSGYPITVVTTSIPILISVIAGAYSIHYVQAYLSESRQLTTAQEAVAAATAKVAKPILIACLTSAVGAFSLIVFKVAAIAEFGVVTAIGTVASLIVAMSMLPVVLRSTRGPYRVSSNKTGSAAVALSERALARLTDISTSWPATTLLLFIIIFVVASASVFQLRTGANFADYLPKDHETRKDMQYFDSRLGGSRYFDILVEANTENGAQQPEFLAAVADIQSYAESLSYVGKTLSFVDVVKRIDAVVQEKKDGDIPSSYDLASQYLLLYSISSSPEDFSDLVDYDYRRVKIFVPVKTSDQDVHQEVYRLIRKRVEEIQVKSNIRVEYGGNLLVWIAQMQYIITGKIQNIISSVLIVVVLCAFFFRSIKYALIAAAPIVLSIICTFGAMAWLGIRLEVSTAVITGVTIGIGIDFSCHFLYHYRKAIASSEFRGVDHVIAGVRSAVSSSGSAIAFNIAATVAGFSAFLFSAFKPIQNFGYLISANMIFSGVATFAMIPAMLYFADRNSAIRRSSTEGISYAVD